jgi:hypothetical protein
VSIDHHTIAAVSIAGIFFDVLGSLDLAYDLLGGRHGPLRLLTRAVTYSVVFGVGYGIGLGLFFGLAAGIATGITVSVELNRASGGLEHYSLFIPILNTMRTIFRSDGSEPAALGSSSVDLLCNRFSIGWPCLMSA